MKRLRNIVRGFLCRHCPRYKFWRICRAIGIKAYPWQRDFALRKRESFDELHSGRRRNGKTTAVMLRLLMADPDGRTDPVPRELRNDVGFCPLDIWAVYWYDSTYKRLAQQCAAQGIPVVYFNIWHNALLI